MAQTYTTNFTTVTDGDTTSYTPQNLVQKNALIDVIDAEAQWRGISNTNYDTTFVQRTNSDSATATTETVQNSNTNTVTVKTEGDTDVQEDTREYTDSFEGQFGGKSGQVFASAPLRQQVDVSGGNSTAIPKEYTLDYYVVEDTGGRDSGIDVSWDDDPYDAINFDSSTNNVSVDRYEKKRVGGFTFDFEGRGWSTSDKWRVYESFDGGSIRYDDVGGPNGTTGLRIEQSLVYTIRTVEQTVNQETKQISFPDVPAGHDFVKHITRTYIDGDLDTRRETQTRFDDVEFPIESPPEAGATKTAEWVTVGESSSTVNKTATASYPSVPSGNSFVRHRLEVFSDGDKVLDRRFSSSKAGETESVTSKDPTTPVSLEITTVYSNTTSTTNRTVDPSLEGDFLPAGLNTDNVVFAIDTSGSVNQTKQQDVARQVLGQLPDSSNAALVEFDFDANIVESLDSLSSNRSDVEDGINSLDSDGGTDISRGLRKAQDILTGLDGSIILISDGESSDDPADAASDIGNDGIQISSIKIDDGNSSKMEEIADVSGGFFFEGDVDAGVFGTTLNDGELTSWQPLSGITRTQQTFTHSIDGIGKADFRWRFTWEFDTPQPVNGTTGFYDSSAGVWREVAVANPADESLEYNHVSVYNDTEDEWGALDVVDTTNENAIESHQFYDEDAGWLAPREFNSV